MRREQGKPLRAVKWNVKRAGLVSVRAVLSLVLLLPSIAACLGGDGTTSTPAVAPTDTPEAISSPTPVPTPTAAPSPTPGFTPTPVQSPNPTATDRPPPGLTSGCTQADVFGNPTPADVGPEPTPDSIASFYLTECSSNSQPFGWNQIDLSRALHSYSYYFIEWTPDGEKLMLNAPKEDETIGYEIYLVSADGSGTRLLVDASPEHAMLVGFHADLSPDGSTLVYSTCTRTSNRGYGVFEIASLSVEEGTSRFLSNDGRNIEIYPVWSPDGSRIAYLVSRPWLGGGSERTQVFTMPANGGHSRNLTPHLNWRYYANPVPPTWSPDGERLAYLQQVGSFVRFYTVAADGSGLHGVTTVTTGASWAPEGRRIAFGKHLWPKSSPEAPSSTLCVAELDEFGRPHLSHVTPTDAFGGPLEITHVSWSPDGDEILFIVGNKSREYHDLVDEYTGPSLPLASSVYLVRPDGTALRRLLQDERPYTAAAWSPDSSQIAVRVDPQLGYVYEKLPDYDYLEIEQTNPLFEVLIVDRDGTVQTVLGRDEVLDTR